jgi:hypothetical protein
MPSERETGKQWALPDKINLKICATNPCFVIIYVFKVWLNIDG